MAANQQGWATRLRMNFDQWAQRWWQIVQSIAAIAAILVRRAIDFCLTIVQRVVRAQAIDSGP